MEQLFLCTTPSEKQIRMKIDDILKGAINAQEVLISGWIDGAFVDLLKKLLDNGVKVRIIARSSTQKGDKDAIKELKLSGAEIKTNNMVHARLLIVKDKETIISSADLKTDSMDNNREAGIYCTIPTIVRGATKFFEKVWDENSSQ